MTEERLIRAFICIELPQSLKTRIEQIQTQLRPLSTGVTWVRAQNIHLTLKFLGNVQEQQLPHLIEAVSGIVTLQSPFTLTPEGHGIFPNAKSPRVFWLGIREGSGQLAHLQTSLEDELEKLGFAKESRPFKPHLTIGRARPYRKPKELTPAFLGLTFSEDPFEVRDLTVMQSDLKPSGAVYTPLRVIHLRSGHATT